MLDILMEEQNGPDTIICVFQAIGDDAKRGREFMLAAPN